MDNFKIKRLLRNSKNKYSLLFFIVIFCFTLTLNARDVKVSIFNSQNIKSIMLTPVSGEYEIVSGDKQILRVLKNEIIQIVKKGNQIQVKGLSKSFGSFPSIEIKSLSRISSFRIKPIMPSLESRSYEGNLSIKIGTDLLLINIVNIESYIAGVVETEGGPSSPLEYYKSQALLCRTYAFGHFNRHEDDGFELCDEVHCQAYHGMCNNNADIEEACSETSGQIIVDKNNKIITAAFHSNCGGETVNSEHAWTLPLPYLKSIQEDFCKQAPHSKWNATIKTEKWKRYLLKNGFKVANFTSSDFKYAQKGRQLYYVIGADSIKLKTVRSDWKFKSTYFSIIPIDDELYFKGIGYGHGVGLCQEGAMEMARKGKNYKEILQHYYNGVRIISY